MHLPFLEPHDVLHLLATAARPSNLLGASRETRVYRLPHWAPGTEQYALRVEHGVDLKQALARSTALVPVSHLASNHRFGQPVMQLDGEAGVTLMLCQPGFSITQILEQHQKFMSEVDAHRNIFEQILSMQVRSDANPFLDMMDTAYDAAYSGKKIDFNRANLMIDHDQDHVLLVDQFENRTEFDAAHPDAEAVKKLTNETAILIRKLSTCRWEQDESHDAALVDLIHLLLDARDKTIAAKAHQSPQEKGLKFARVDDVAVVSLKAPPKTLVLALDQLRDKTTATAIGA